MNAVLFYFFGTFPLGDYMRNTFQGSNIGNATRDGYTNLVSRFSATRQPNNNDDGDNETGLRERKNDDKL